MTDTSIPHNCDVAIIGAGPAGLSAAVRLRQLGIEHVHVFERESHAGGIPRHCGHLAFGWREFRWGMTGPTYAKRLVNRARSNGVVVHTGVSVVALERGGRFQVAGDFGCREVRAKRVLMCTGVRETPRSTRLVSGQRPLGVVTTGALQSMVYLENQVPCSRPVIVGTELVAFSSLLTLAHVNLKPVGMLEEQTQLTAWPWLRLLAVMKNVPIRFNTKLIEIVGKSRVEAVLVQSGQSPPQRLACDGVIFTGQFVPEASLLSTSHLQCDPSSGGPSVDQYGRCSDPFYFATGNLLRPVETAGWCWSEGRQCASWIAQSLAEELPTDAQAPVTISTESAVIRYVVPQRLARPNTIVGMRRLQLRFTRCVSGTLSVRGNGRTIWRTTITTRPERRVFIPMDIISKQSQTAHIAIHFDEH